MASKHTPETLQQAIRYYSDVDTCQQALVEARWPDGVACPTCGSNDVTYLANQRRWQCKAKPYHPKRQFSAKKGTIFEDSPIGLDKWFVAIWLIASAKNGISSYELHRAIGITQKSAWFVLHRIRLAMQTRSFEKKLEGEVEVDETFIGGKARFMHKRRLRQLRSGRGQVDTGKTTVQGMLRRSTGDSHSLIRMRVMPTTWKEDLQRTVREHIAPDATVITDAMRSYQGLDADFVHKVIDHATAYVQGNVHTNGLENFWSLLKRSLGGTYISVEPFHMFRYLDEQAFRFNTRKQNDSSRFKEMTQRVIGRRLTYADLTAKPEAQSA